MAGPIVRLTKNSSAKNAKSTKVLLQFNIKACADYHLLYSFITFFREVQKAKGKIQTASGGKVNVE